MSNTTTRHCRIASQWLPAMLGVLILPLANAAEPPAPAGGYPPPPPWVRVNKDWLSGKMLTPAEHASDALPKGYFDERELATKGRYDMVHAGRVETFVFDTMTSMSRSYDFPGDEVVDVRDGRMIMVDDPSGRVQVFNKGEYYIVPKHWRGTWQFVPINGVPAREFSQGSGGQWDNMQAPLNRAALPQNIKVPGVQAVDLKAAEASAKPINFDAPGTPLKGDSTLLGHVVFAGEPSFVFLKSPAAATYEKATTPCDSVVRVLKGSLEVQGNGKSEKFGPDEIVVLTATFKGKVSLSAGFTGVSIITKGTESALSPAKPVPAVNVCPAI